MNSKKKSFGIWIIFAAYLLAYAYSPLSATLFALRVVISHDIVIGAVGTFIIFMGITWVFYLYGKKKEFFD